MTIARALCILGAAILLASVFWAASQASIGASFQAIVADPWGVVSLIDLYLGFVLISIVIWLFERSPIRALCWIVPIYVLGNTVSAVWLAWQLPKILKRQT